MAKFEDLMAKSTLTWSELPDAITRKVERFETLYASYDKAYEAGDTKVSEKYHEQLTEGDLEIVQLISAHESSLSTPKVEDTPPTPKVEDTPPTLKTEDTPPTPKSEEKPDKGEDKKDTWSIGMF